MFESDRILVGRAWAGAEGSHRQCRKRLVKPRARRKIDAVCKSVAKATKVRIFDPPHAR
jgi:hypothetical protein